MSNSTGYSAPTAQDRATYESILFSEVHYDILDYLPRKEGGKVLDIGCGSARDAIGFSNLGFDVVAVDPNEELISGLTKDYFSNPKIKFLVDKLPRLSAVKSLHKKFDVIMMTGVWHFIPPEHRLPAMDTLASMLRYKGSLIIYLKRDYNKADGYESELLNLAELLQFRLIYEASMPDAQNRPGIFWKLLKFKNKKDPLI